MDTAEFRRLRAEGKHLVVAHSDMAGTHHECQGSGRGKSPVDPEYVTIEEFADWIRITPMAARTMIRRDEVLTKAVVKFGRRVRIRIALVREWMSNANAA